MITLLGAVVGAELWQRRKLRRIARQIARQGRLMEAAIRITHEVRGSIDISRMLAVSTVEVAGTLNIEHCCLLLFGQDHDKRRFVCSCDSSNHESDIEIAVLSAIKYLQDEGHDRLITHNYPNPAEDAAGRTNYPACGLPLTRDANGLGGILLALSSDSTRLWLDSEVQMLLAVAHQLSLSVAHARVFAEKVAQSLTDPLTNCLNRRGFDEQFENHFQNAIARNRSISLVMIDFDHFKAINDNYGHPVGDQVLRNLSGLLLQEAGNGVIAARVGGEEFALLLSDRSFEEVAEVAERVRKRVEDMTVPGLDDRLTVSCGVAHAPTDAQSADRLFLFADKALYRAKASGRNRVCYFADQSL